MKKRKMLSTSRYAAVGAMVVLGLSSCQLDPMTVSPVEAYTESFIREYGLIDPNQDWNMAQRSSVTVSTPTTDVKIYAKIGGVYYLVGDYKDVSGTQELKFDVPKDVEDVILQAGRAKVKARIGQTLSLGEALSRTEYQVGVDKVIEITELTDVAFKDNWLRMPKGGVLSYEDVAPENCDNRYNTGVDLNFLYTSKGPFILHPVYWNTTSNNVLGIYYYCDPSTEGAEWVTNYDEGTTSCIKRIPVFARANNNIFFGYNPNNSENNAPATEFEDLNGVHATAGYVEDGEELIFPYLDKQSTYWAQVGNPSDLNNNYLAHDCSDAKHQQVMSKGVKVDIPIGMEYGMYLYHGTSGEYFYSESSLNFDPYVECAYPDGVERPVKNGGDRGYPVTYTSKIERPWQAAHAATFIGSRGLRALMFEDWSEDANSDMDLNDMVFVFFGADPGKETDGLPTVTPQETVTASPYSWMIAAEDLGDTNDRDFNDVVVGIEYVSGQEVAYLTPLAAGGTLPIELCFGDDKTPIACQGETQFHKWFKGDPSTTTMINTISINYEAKERVELPVPADFSLANFETNSFAYNPTGSDENVKNMGGFTLRVERQDGTFDHITPPGLGAAPQMICVPGGWAWPIERANIREAYGKFADWVNDRSKNTDWYSDKSTITTSKLIFTPGSGNTSTGSGSGAVTGGGTPSGTGTDFVIRAPEGTRQVVPGENASVGYLRCTINLAKAEATGNINPDDDPQLLKAWRYYKAYLSSDAGSGDVKDDDREKLLSDKAKAQFRSNFINALLAHYWNIDFYTATSDNVYPAYNPDETFYNCLSGTPYGNGHTFMLLDVVKLDVISNYQSTIDVVVKVTETSDVSGQTGGPGNQGGGDEGGGDSGSSNTYSAQIENAVIPGYQPDWNCHGYLVTSPVALTEGTVITITGSSDYEYYFIKGDSGTISEKKQSWNPSFTLTAADIAELNGSQKLYLCSWNTPITAVSISPAAN